MNSKIKVMQKPSWLLATKIIGAVSFLCMVANELLFTITNGREIAGIVPTTHFMRLVFVLGSIVGVIAFSKAATGKDTITKWPAQLFALVIILFVLVRLPFFDTSFIAQLHSDKYSTYVPNADYMFRTGDILSNENLAYTPLIPELDKSDGKYEVMPIVPLTIYPFMTLVPTVGLEVATRIYTTILGIGLLIAIYLLIRKTFSNEIAWLTTIILALMPAFQMSTFITIADLCSLLFIVLAIVAQQYRRVSLAYVLAGLGFVSKLSLIPFGAPVMIYLIWRQKEKHFGYELLKYLSASLLSLVAFKVILDRVPGTNFPIDWLLFATFWIISIAGPVAVVRLSGVLQPYFQRYSWPMLITGFVIGLLLFKDNLSAFAEAFLPELDTLFYAPMYYKILTDSFTQLPVLLMPFVPLGLYKLMRTSPKANYIAWLLGVCCYIVVGAKAIYFHEYYKLPMMITLAVIVAFGVANLLKTSKLKLNGLIVLLSLVLISQFWLYPKYLDRRKEVDIREISGYVYNNLPDDKIVIRSDVVSKNVVLYADIPILNFTDLKADVLFEVRKEVKELGLSGFLKKRNVYYYLSRGELNPEYFISWFSKDLPPRSRTLELKNETIGVLTTTQKEEVLNTFELETLIDGYYIYKLK